MTILISIVCILGFFILIGTMTIGFTMLITKLKTGDWFTYLELWEEEDDPW